MIGVSSVGWAKTNLAHPVVVPLVSPFIVRLDRYHAHEIMHDAEMFRHSHTFGSLSRNTCKLCPTILPSTFLRFLSRTFGCTHDSVELFFLPRLRCFPGYMVSRLSSFSLHFLEFSVSVGRAVVFQVSECPFVPLREQRIVIL